MSITTKVPATVIAGLATVALAAPGAGAMPIHEPSEFDAGHASTATVAQQRQDLRSADARDAAVHPKRFADPAFGQPTPVRASQPQPASSDTSDDGFPWAIVLGVAGIGLVGGGAAVGATRSGGRRARRARAAA
jgi:hypothetical protein